jgi:hypothetical protein
MEASTMAQTPDLGGTSEPGGAVQRGSQRIADYLRRYPEISDQERTDLIGVFRQLSNLDIAFILSDPEVAPKFERFRAEHRRETRLPVRDYAALLVLAALTLVLIVYEVAIMT